MGWGRILPVGIVLWASAAAAQAPWPAQQPQQQQQAPWPGQQQPQGQAAWPSSPAQASQQSTGAAQWPDQHSAAAAPMAPMMGAPGMSPMGGGGGGGGGTPPCFTEFTKLRTEVEKRGAAAKAANERHAPREEFCKVITSLAVAAEKWAKFTEKEAKGCGIPGDAVTQIKGESEHLGKIKTQICSAGPAVGGPPSLSEALGTDRTPIDDGNKATAKRGGVLDSMTGAPIR